MSSSITDQSLEFPAVFSEELKALSSRDKDRLSALCLSGGGIRSAAFSLGVIQALAQEQLTTTSHEDGSNRFLIEDIDYLSTVSGGGFIGGWLSAWLSRADFRRVQIGLTERYKEIESKPLLWLRSNTNYLTPRLGLLSGDAIGALALSIRNLLLNWMILLPALAALIISVKIVGIFSNWIVFWGDKLYQMSWGYFFAKTTLELSFLPFALICLHFALYFEMRSRPRIRPFGPNRNITLKRHLLPSVLSAFFLANFLASDLTGSLLLQCAKENNIRSDELMCHEAIFREKGANLKTRVKLFRFDFLGQTLSVSNDKIVPTFGNNILRFYKATYLVFGIVFGVAFYLSVWHLLVKNKRPTYSMYFMSLSKHEVVPEILRNNRLFFAWLISGGAYGALAAIGLMLYLSMPDEGYGVAPHKVPIFYLQIVFGVPWLIVSQAVAQMLFVGLASEALTDIEREWYGYTSGWLLVSALAWFVSSLLIFSDYIIEIYLGSYAKDLLKLKDFIPIIVAITGLLSAFLAKRGDQSERDSNRWFSNFMSILFFFSAILFATTIVVSVSSLIDHIVFEQDLLSFIKSHPEDSIGKVIGRAAEDSFKLFVSFFIFVGWTALADYHINTNHFSLHAIYRNRLIRAYLGASRRRNRNRLIDMDEGDNPKMSSLIRPSNNKDWRPFHVLNASLNLLSTSNLAWQERKAMSFTISPLHCGSRQLGYRRSSEYTEGGISLGTAMAISGAAASPSMGSYSAPGKTFLMTLFNMRLGAWLGNPGQTGSMTYMRSGPPYALKPLLKEAFGLTNDRDAYVHLSDGGHFDNLGLYEMVRRGCRSIICVDASHDPQLLLWDIGNSQRKIQIDFGINIDFFGLNDLRRPKNREASEFRGSDYYMIGLIDYPNAPPGLLLYIKPIHRGNEGIGIRGYAERHPDFPNERTSKQWFSESQFESYRMLGLQIMTGILEEGRSHRPVENGSLAVYLERLLEVKRPEK